MVNPTSPILFIIQHTDNKLPCPVTGCDQLQDNREFSPLFTHMRTKHEDWMINYQPCDAPCEIRFCFFADKSEIKSVETEYKRFFEETVAGLMKDHRDKGVLHKISELDGKLSELSKKRDTLEKKLSSHTQALDQANIEFSQLNFSEKNKEIKELYPKEIEKFEADIQETDTSILDLRRKKSLEEYRIGSNYLSDDLMEKHCFLVNGEKFRRLTPPPQ